MSKNLIMLGLCLFILSAEGVGSHYEGHKYVTHEQKHSTHFPKSSVVFALLAKNLLQRQV